MTGDNIEHKYIEAKIQGRDGVESGSRYYVNTAHTLHFSEDK